MRSRPGIEAVLLFRVVLRSRVLDHPFATGYSLLFIGPRHRNGALRPLHPFSSQVQANLGERVEELAVKVLREVGPSATQADEEAIATRLVGYMEHARQLLSARSLL